MKLELSPSRHDHLINAGFVLALIMAAVPDILLYPKAMSETLGSTSIATLLLTFSDIVLFCVVFVLLKKDIKRRRNVEAALHTANKDLHTANELKSEFLRVAAHDLRNPLHAIMNLAHFIPKDLQKPEVLTETADHISRASEDMLRLINDLIETASIDGGNVKLDRIAVELNTLAHDVVARNDAVALKKNLRLTFSGDGEYFTEADENRLRRALENLISNAIKFSPHGKSVQVSVKRAGGKFRLEVADEGPGMSAEEMPRLFGKFQRLSARPTGGETSTGLGLSIVKRIVELHGGRVWAESEGPGKGSRFVIELPEFPAKDSGSV